MAIVSDGGTIFQAPFLTNNSCITSFTFFCWVKYPTTVTGAQTLFVVAGTATNGTGLIKSGGANRNTANYQDDSTNDQGAQETAVPLANTWEPLCGVFNSRTSVFLYTPSSFNNNNVNVGTVGNASWNQFQFLGRQTSASGGAITSFLNAGGMLAECALWLGALSGNEVQALIQQNVSPWRMRRPLVYLPLRNSVQDYGPYKLAFTSAGTNGTTFTGDHPITEGLQRWSRAPMLLGAAATMPVVTGPNVGVIGGGVSNLL